MTWVTISTGSFIHQDAFQVWISSQVQIMHIAKIITTIINSQEKLNDLDENFICVSL